MLIEASENNNLQSQCALTSSFSPYPSSWGAGEYFLLQF